MIREIELKEGVGLLSAAPERMVIADSDNDQILIMTPVSVTGYIDEIHEDITCLTFELDERLNLEIYRNFGSSIYVNDKELTNGEVYDFLESQRKEIVRLQAEIKKLQEERLSL